MSNASSESITIPRDELYELVWSTSMRQLAPRFGLSDVGLAKICDAHDIPRPPRGYWTKKEFGQAPPRTPLPQCSDPKLQTVRLRQVDAGAVPRPAPVEPEFDPDIAAVLERARALPVVTVAESLRGLHPLVQATKDGLERAAADRNQILTARTAGPSVPLSVSVSKASVRRALLYLDAVVKAVERVGGTVQVRGQ